MAVTLPNTLINGAPTDATKVQENFEALRAHTNGVESDLADAEATQVADRVIDRAYTDSKTAAERSYTNAHINDTSAAHLASRISFSPTGSLSSTNVQSAISEERTERVNADNSLDSRLDSVEAKTAQTGWSNIGLGSAWVDFSGRQDAEYRKVGDEVQMRGQIRNGTLTNGVALCTLPSGYRPLAADIFPCPGTSGNAYIFVDTNGRVELYNADNNNGIGLSGVRFSVTA